MIRTAFSLAMAMVLLPRHAVAPKVNEMAQRCPAATLTQIRTHLPADVDTPILVFATWCGPCLEHIRDTPGDTVLIAVFDTSTAVENAMTRLHITTPCFLGTDAAAQLGVKNVPARFIYRGGVFTRSD